MKSFFTWVLNHYFYFMGVFGIGSMLDLALLDKSSLLVFISALFLFFRYLLTEKFACIDKLVLLTMLYLITVGLFNIYESTYFYFGVRYVVGTMVFFFVGKSSLMVGDRFFSNMITPLIIIYIFALLLFLFPPSWYLMWKTQNLNEMTNENSIWEMLRLSGFWIYPYFISYSACLASLYLLKKILQGNRKNFGVLLFFIFVLFLAGQRVALFYSLACLGLTVFFIFRKNTLEHRTKICILFLLTFVVCLILFVLIQYVSEEQLSFLMDRIMSEKTDDNIVVDRFSMFSDFWNKEFSLFGDGVGRYSHIANLDGNISITDCQYLLMLYEYGVIGVFMFGCIFVSSICVALRKWHYNIYELSVIFFFLLTFLGANSLGSQEMHSAILWLCIGRVFNSEAFKYKKKIKDYL